MVTVDKLSRTPIYEQLVEGVEREVLLGLLPEEAQLPSLRELSTRLDLNPNTIQKAYLELEHRGVVRAAPGRGCFVLPGAQETIRRRLSERLSELSALALSLRMAGLPEETLHDAIRKAYETHSVKNGGTPE
jgi:GntR family transcriptional regulator